MSSWLRVMPGLHTCACALLGIVPRVSVHSYTLWLIGKAREPAHESGRAPFRPAGPGSEGDRQCQRRAGGGGVEVDVGVRGGELGIVAVGGRPVSMNLSIRPFTRSRVGCP